MKKGFTLVELSMALVVVGLLIAGLLVAQSLVDSSQINSQVKQIGEFDAAVITFKQKYKYLPGDSRFYGGDGDGVLDYGAPFDDDVTGFMREQGAFWNQLFPEKYAASTWSVPGSKIITSGATKNAPLAAMGKKGSSVIAISLSLGNSLANKTNPASYYVILAASQVQAVAPWGNYCYSATTTSNSAVTVLSLMSLDKKMDDKVPNTGNVMSGGIKNVSVGYGGLVATPIATCSSGAAYQVANTGYECTPMIRIGSRTGSVQ